MRFARWSLAAVLAAVALAGPLAGGGAAEEGQRGLLRMSLALALFAWACGLRPRAGLRWHWHPLLSAALFCLACQVVSIPGALNPPAALSGLSDRAALVALLAVAMQALVLPVHTELACGAVAAGMLGHLLLAAGGRPGALVQPGLAEQAAVSAPVLIAAALVARHITVRVVCAAGAALAVALAAAAPVVAAAMVAGLAAAAIHGSLSGAAPLPRLAVVALGVGGAAAVLYGVLPASPPPAPLARGPLMAATTMMMRDHPLAGVGIRNWGDQYPRYGTKMDGAAAAPAGPAGPGSDALRAVAETGVVGLLGIVLLVWVAAGSGGAAGTHPDPRMPALVNGAFGAAVTQGALALMAPRGTWWSGWALLAVLAGALTVGRTVHVRERSVAWVLAAPCAAWLAIVIALGESHRFEGGTWLVRARVELAAGQREEAHRSFHEAARLRPGDAATLIDAARLCVAMRHREQALALATQALEQAPSDIRAREAVAGGHLLRGAFEQAAAAFSEMLVLEPGSRTALEQLPRALASAGKNAEARDGYLRLIARAGENAERLVGLGRAMWAAEDLNGAIPLFARAARTWPGDVEGHLALAQARRLAKDVTGAETEFRQVLALDPEHSSAHIHLGLMLHQTGRRADGLALLLEEALSTTPSYELRAGLLYDASVTAKAELSKLETREIALRRARAELALQPRHAGLRRGLALYRAQQGDRTGAVTDLRALVAEEPRDAAAGLALGRFLRQQSLFGDAAAALQRAAAAPGAPPAVLMELAMVLEAQGHRRSAELALMRLQSSVPRDSTWAGRVRRELARLRAARR